MFESLSHLALQQYWWFIIALLAGLLVFLMFVQGGQTLIYQLGRNEIERKIIVNALGRKWEFTFTTLVTFGGAFFASFPLFYSTSFGGAYWVWIAILFVFILQAVSYEFRSKPANFLGRKTFDIFLIINGLLGTILIGAAVGTFFTGSLFEVNKLNITNLSGKIPPIISSWKTPYHGLEAIWTVENLAFLQNIALGLSVFFLSRVLAILYFYNSVDNENIIKRSRLCLKVNSLAFVVFFLFFLIRLMFLDGWKYQTEGTITTITYPVANVYWQNIIAMPWNTILLLVGIVLVLWGIVKSLIKPSPRSIWFSGIGTVFTVMALFFLAGYNNTAYYPSTYEAQSSLTITNSSSSHYTLTVMSYVSLMVPFVLAYIVYAWKAVNKKRITAEEFDDESHAY